MSRLTVKEQIREIDSAAEEFPEYLDLLNLRKAILEILLPVDDSSTKGARDALSDEALRDLQAKAVASKRPISSFLESSIFDEDEVSSIAGEIAEYLMRSRPGGEALDALLKALRSRVVDAREAIKATLGEDAEWFQRYGEEYGVEPSLLLFMFETPLRPFFEDLARRVEGKLRETWWEPFCPVCGRNSVVARIRQGKRYMTCTFCGAEYLVDLFFCTNCGNNDPRTIGFIAPEGLTGCEINYCEKCNRYTKVLYEDRLMRKIPRGLEDLLTRGLDELARGEEFGFKRA